MAMRLASTRSLSLRVGRCAVHLSRNNAACLQRSFSSSTPPSSSNSGSNASEFETGLSGVSSLLSRVMDRSSSFQRYQQAQVFSPEYPTLAKMITFLTLSMPQRTQIDAVEFLEGARHACTAQLAAVNSLEFGRYIGGEIRQCESAELLKTYCTPGFYQSASSNVKLAYAMRNLIFESQGVAIESMYLKSAEYARLTEQEYKDEVAGVRNPPLLWSDNPSVERLRLALEVTTVENVKMNYFKRAADASKMVQQQNAYTWLFESRVTRPEDLDWRIAGVYKVSGRVLDLPPSSAKEEEARAKK